jgi:hypothetical protein
MSLLKSLASLVVVALLASVYTQAQSVAVKDCLPVLSKDYYSYAEQNSLQEDFLKSIDAESWEQLRQSNQVNATGLFSAGLFSFSDDYKSFDEKRSKYLETIHYSRNRQQAVSILQITTGPRAYPAYEACLRSLGDGPPLRVWASREDMGKIELHVKYVNPAGTRSMVLAGLVSGGAVTGAPPGHLWRDGKKWGVNQEVPFIITRTKGVSETTVIVARLTGPRQSHLLLVEQMRS